MRADNPLEHDQRTLGAAADPFGNGAWVERNIAQRYDATALADGATTYRWNHGQLVAILQGIVPSGVLGVDSAAKRPRKRAKIVAGAELAPGIGGGGARRQGQIDIGLSDQLARLGK